MHVVCVCIYIYMYAQKIQKETIVTPGVSLAKEQKEECITFVLLREKSTKILKERKEGNK